MAHARQARSQARRDALLAATVQVAAERGAAAVTHRAVTEQAGLPLATVSYFFDSISDLAAEAMRVFVEADVDSLAALAEALSATHSTPDDIAAAFVVAAAPRWPETAALFEAYLHAARNPEDRASASESLAAVRGVASVAAAAAGAPEPAAIAPALVALTHGFALHQLALPDEVDSEDLRRAVRTLFLGHLLEAGHVDAALALASNPPVASSPDLAH